LAVYGRTLAPSVVALFDDSLEFPLVCHRLAIAHQTGYPLYTLLGKLFSLAVPANVAWAVNLLSAVAGALTVGLVYLVGRQLTRRRLPALLGAVALAASPVFWSQAVIAEVYTLNSAFVAAMLWLALRWARDPWRPVTPFSLLQGAPQAADASLSERRNRWLRLSPRVRNLADRLGAAYRRLFPPVPPQRRLQLQPLAYGLAGLYGLSLTHHRTMLLLAPALLLFLLLAERRALSRAALLGPEQPGRPRWRQFLGRPIVRLAACFLVPLLFYLYLPLRGEVGSLDGTYANSWTGFWRWVLASSYGAFLGENPLARNLDAAGYAQLFWQQFGPLGLALALVGLVHLLRQPKALALTSLAFATYTAFAVLYRAPDPEVFFIPAFLLVAVWIGVGLDGAADLYDRRRGRTLAARRLIATCGLLLFLVAVAQPLLLAVRNYPDLGRSRDWAARDYALYALQQPLPAGSTIVGLLGEMTLLRYFQETMGLRPDLKTVVADDEAARREAVEQAVAAGQPVYVTRFLPGLADRYTLDAVTGLVDAGDDLQILARVAEPETDLPSPPQPVDLEPLPQWRLLGYGLREHGEHWQSWARLRLWWQAPPARPQERLKVSARLLNAGGDTVAAHDAEPVGGAYPTTAWRPGEVVADAYEIPLPTGAPAGEYRLLVIVYEADTARERGRAELGPVHLVGSPVRPPRRALEESVGQTVYARFRDLELLGFTPPDPERAYEPGDTLPLDLLWQARGQPSGAWRLALWLEAGEDYPISEVVLGGALPAEQWQTGQTVRQWVAMQVPDLPAGTYRLMMRVLRDGQPVPWGRGVLPLGSDMELGEVQVIP